MRIAQPIAAWLVAKPFHAVIGLAFTLLLPFAQIVTGAAMTTVVLHYGWRQAMLFGLIAAGIVGIMAAITAAPVVTIWLNALAFWVPASGLAALLRQTRSLTLALQVSAILAVVGTVVLHIALPDPIEFWKQVLTEFADAFREMGFDQQADLLINQQDLIAPQMTVLFVLTTWSLLALVLALGYGLFQALPDNRARFGRFCDMNFGRVLALVAAVASLLAWPIGADWLQDVAFVSFAIFWIQGLSVVHWLHTEGPLPVAFVVVVYAMLPVLNALLVIGLAVMGYSDAWLDYRARLRRSSTPE